MDKNTQKKEKTVTGDLGDKKITTCEATTPEEKLQFQKKWNESIKKNGRGNLSVKEGKATMTFHPPDSHI